MPTINTPSHPVELLQPAERNRLFQLCTWLTGDPSVAEDLVQETLIIGWQQIDQLRNATRAMQWLEGIARNRCRQWHRTTRRQQKRLAEPAWDNQNPSDLSDTMISQAFDVEIELERAELAKLLDLALAQLPPLTRSVLIERYIHESPQAEIARQLGLSEGAVEQRIQRGKLALRRVLTTNLQADAAAFGLLRPDDCWQETRIWCPACGRQRMQAMLVSGATGSLRVHCTSCGANFGSDIPGLVEDVRSCRTAFTQVAQWHDRYFQPGLAQGKVACAKCGHPTPLHLSATNDIPTFFANLPPATPDTYGFWAFCSHCQQWGYQADLAAMALFTPTVQQFWRNHPRIEVIPEQVIERDGLPTLLISYRDRIGSAQIDLFIDPKNLCFHGTHAADG